MRYFTRKPLCAALVSAGLLSLPAKASTDCGATCSSGLAVVYLTLVTAGERLVLDIQTASKHIKSEIQKQTRALRHMQEGIATYQQQEILRREVRDIEDRFKAPSTLCATVKTGQAVRETQVTQGQAAAQFIQNRLRSAQGEASPQARLKARQQASLTDFCSDMDARAGRCSQTARSGAVLPNGDITAAYLFSDPKGETLTYTPQQTKAVGALVDRFMGLPPATLPTKCHTPECVAFDEFRKDYLAMYGLPLHSFSQIMSGYLPQKDLGRLSGLSLPGQADTISQREMMNRYVRLKLSEDTMRRLLEDPSSETLLKEVLHNQGYQLAIQFELFRQRERYEALVAQDVALMAQWQLKPRVEAQRNAALQSAMREGGAKTGTTIPPLPPLPDPKPEPPPQDPNACSNTTLITHYTQTYLSNTPANRNDPLYVALMEAIYDAMSLPTREAILNKFEEIRHSSTIQQMLETKNENGRVANWGGFLLQNNLMFDIERHLDFNHYHGHMPLPFFWDENPCTFGWGRKEDAMAFFLRFYGRPPPPRPAFL
jgi:hypothetical protein